MFSNKILYNIHGAIITPNIWLDKMSCFHSMLIIPGVPQRFQTWLWASNMTLLFGVLNKISPGKGGILGVEKVWKPLVYNTKSSDFIMLR